MTGMSRALSVFLATDDVFKAMRYLSIIDVPDYGVQKILHEVTTEVKRYFYEVLDECQVHETGKSSTIQQHSSRTVHLALSWLQFSTVIKVKSRMNLIFLDLSCTPRSTGVYYPPYKSTTYF